MEKKILDVLDGLRSSGGGSELVAQFVETRDDDPGTLAIWQQYQQAVDEVRDAWGEPVYEGIGPRAGVAYQGPGPPESPLSPIGDALSFAWWRTDSIEAALMLCGHDANTLLMLSAVVCVRRLETEQGT